jgi:hypothetical protein
MPKNPRPRGSGIFILNQRDSIERSDHDNADGARDTRQTGPFLELDRVIFAPLTRACRIEVGGG